MKDREMNEREKKFALEYLIDNNATRAYVAAGFQDKRPGKNAYKLLARPHIAEFIKAEQQKTAKELNITKEFIIQQYLDLIESARTDGDFGQDRTNWNKSLAQLSKLLGLDAPEIKQISLTVEQPLFGPEDIEQDDNDIELLND